VHATYAGYARHLLESGAVPVGVLRKGGDESGNALPYVVASTPMNRRLVLGEHDLVYVIADEEWALERGLADQHADPTGSPPLEPQLEVQPATCRPAANKTHTQTAAGLLPCSVEKSAAAVKAEGEEVSGAQGKRQGAASGQLGKQAMARPMAWEPPPMPPLVPVGGSQIDRSSAAPLLQTKSSQAKLKPQAPPTEEGPTEGGPTEAPEAPNGTHTSPAGGGGGSPSEDDGSQAVRTIRAQASLDASPDFAGTLSPLQWPESAAASAANLQARREAMAQARLEGRKYSPPRERADPDGDLDGEWQHHEL